jgi:thymidylate kinase
VANSPQALERAPAPARGLREVPGEDAREPLAQSLHLFRAFDAAGVRYCHYKSNQHLLPALAGDTDLDILLDARHAREAQVALGATGYKRFDAKMAASYPAVEDYLGFDAETGKLIHIHLYHRLLVGQPHLKGYQLQYQDGILDGRVRDGASGVYTSHPTQEMQLLLLRLTLKARWRDRLREILGRPFLRGGSLREYRWLQERIDPDELRRITTEQLGPRAGEMIEVLAQKPPSMGQLRAFKKCIAPTLARWSSYGALEALPTRVAREAAWLLSGLNRRHLHLSWSLRRTNPTGGRIIAVLGPDGSGKSTIVKTLHKWLSWKLDVYPVYFGSGDGSASLVRLPLKLAKAALGRSRTPRTGAPVDSGALGLERRVSLARAVWAVVLAWEKRAKLRRAVRARNRGMIVLCDRFPQTQVMGYNDGPLLAPWRESGSRWLKWLADWEYELYERVRACAPDLAIKLDVPSEVAISRKPEISVAESQRKRDALQKIQYGPTCEELVIDSTQPLESVLLQVKTAVWKKL